MYKSIKQNNHELETEKRINFKYDEVSEDIYTSGLDCVNSVEDYYGRKEDSD